MNEDIDAKETAELPLVDCIQSPPSERKMYDDDTGIQRKENERTNLLQETSSTKERIIDVRRMYTIQQQETDRAT